MPSKDITIYQLLDSCNIELFEIKYIKVLNSCQPVNCPDCDSEMKIRDSKRRYIIDELSCKIPFNLKRYYCSNCKKLHLEIPDIAAPHKHYEAAIIHNIQSGMDVPFAGDDSTIRKWKKNK